MSPIEQAADILAAAEKALASSATEPAKAGDYDTATFLIDLARDVGALTAKARARSTAEPGTGSNGEGPLSVSIRTTAPSPPPSRARPKKGEYPKFFREGETLVKLGWSPSERAEYEHKSPQKVFRVLAGALAKAGANGRRFTMEHVMPLIDPADNSRISDYQVYVCFAWFRQWGLVIQHGRKGYTLSTKAPLEPMIDTNWNSLPTR